MSSLGLQYTTPASFVGLEEENLIPMSVISFGFNLSCIISERLVHHLILHNFSSFVTSVDYLAYSFPDSP